MNTEFVLFCVSVFGLFLCFCWGLHKHLHCKLLENRCSYYANQWGKAEDHVRSLVKLRYPEDDEDDDDDYLHDEQYKLIMNPDAWKRNYYQNKKSK